MGLTCAGCCGLWSISTLVNRTDTANRKQLPAKPKPGDKQTSNAKNQDGETDKIQREVDAADHLFADGRQEEAITKYKAVFAFADKKSQKDMLRRIVEFEATRGNRAEAKRWIESGLKLGLTPAVSTPAADAILSEAQAEHERKAAAAAKQREAEQARLKEEKDAAQRLEREARATKILADLRSDNTAKRRDAIAAAGELGDSAKQVTLTLVALLADKEDREAAYNSLVAIGKPAVPDLIKGLEHKNLFVRLWSAHALGRIGPAASSAVPGLTERVRSDTSQNVREAARAALQKIGT